MMPYCILVVDDDPDDRELIQRSLSRFTDIGPVLEALDERSCFEQLEAHPEIDCILLDYSLPARDGLAVLKQLHIHTPFTAVVMITGQGSENIAVQAMQNGAQDYITKDSIAPDNLRRVVDNAIQKATMQNKIHEQQENLRQFAHILTHDLRAPLRSIRLAVDLLIEELDPAVAADHIQTTEFIIKSSQRMDQLIVGVDAYNDAEKSIVSSAPVDLNDLLTDVLCDLQADLDTSGAAVLCDKPLPTVYGHAPLIAQLFQNLIGNGIKYNTSQIPQIILSSTRHDGGWQISFEDNGIGIKHTFTDQIFEPFRRLHSKKDFEGTGLGLATCKKIMDRHGGTIHCQSTPGHGSCFILTWPQRESCDRAA